MGILNWSHFLAGVYLFIFAMSLLEDTLKHLAGRPFKKFLQRHTENKLKAIAGGTVVTAVLQSSSVVLLMVLSFVGAGIMSMRNAISVTLGANLGTTLDSWIVATLGFKVELDLISYPVLAISLLITVLLPAREKIKNTALFLTGFSLLFIGLEWMKVSVDGIITGLDIRRYAEWPAHFFILAGIVLTTIIQSSSATMAITLTALYHGIIPFASAAAIVIGSETGTTLKILLSSYGGIPDKKRVAMGNFIFNIMLSVLAGVFLFPLVDFVRDVMGIADPLIGLVTFQTGINIVFIIIFYPFIGNFATFLERLYKANDDESITKYIQPALKQFPDEALKTARKETMRLMMHLISFNRRMLGLKEKEEKNLSWLQNLRTTITKSDRPEIEYGKLKQLHGEILEYLVSLRKENMTADEIEQTGKLIGVARNNIHSAKNMKDIRHNINDLESTVNDTLHSLLHQTLKSEKVFYNEVEKCLLNPHSANTAETIDEMIQFNKSAYDHTLLHIQDILGSDKISELDASTLLNVFREIYSAHKLLLSALKELVDNELDN